MTSSHSVLSALTNSGWVEQGETIGDLPRIDRDTPVFVHEAGHIVEHTEADALTNYADHINTLDSRLDAAVSNTLSDSEKDRARQSLQRLGNTLAFLGNTAFHKATTGMATYWHHLLESRDQLTIGIRREYVNYEYTPHKSGLYVAHCIRQSLLSQDFEDQDKITVTVFDEEHPLSNETVDRVNNEGVLLVDDWAVSGQQLATTVDRLATAGVTPEALEIQLLSATESQIQRGIKGVPVKSYFRRPDLLPSGSTIDASITGAHSSTDYGFRFTLEELGGLLQYRPLPLLHSVARPYRPVSESQYLTAPAAFQEQYDAYHASWQA